MDFLFIIAIALILNLMLITFAIIDLMKRDNVKYLSKMGWIIMMAFVIFSAAIYLLIGRGEDRAFD